MIKSKNKQIKSLIVKFLKLVLKLILHFRKNLEKFRGPKTVKVEATRQ